MRLPIRWRNCLWLIVPLLLWNLLCAPQLTQDIFQSDQGVPQAVLLAEMVLRMAVFGLPLFIPLTWDERMSPLGIGLYVVGTLIYFASWLPLLFAPSSTWSTSTLGLLGPYVTPLLGFFGIALIGHSWSYGLIALLFIVAHAIHGLFALKIF